MSKTNGYFLVSHGSKSPRSLSQVEGVAKIIENQTGMPMGYGCLEGLELDLTAQIENWIDQQPDWQKFWQKLVVIPLFLWAGEHTSQDIPTAVQRVDRPVIREIAPHLGSHPQIANLLLDRFQQAEAKSTGNTGRLLIVHGSNYGSDATSLPITSMKDLANQLQARLAFWNSPTTIAESIEYLVGEDCDRVLALPYFLFAGKITEAIGNLVKTYRQVEYLAVPLTSPEIADLISSGWDGNYSAIAPQ